MLIPLNIDVPLKKASFNYIGRKTYYFFTGNNGDPFAIKA